MARWWSGYAVAPDLDTAITLTKPQPDTATASLAFHATQRSRSHLPRGVDPGRHVRHRNARHRRAMPMAFFPFGGWKNSRLRRSRCAGRRGRFRCSRQESDHRAPVWCRGAAGWMGLSELISRECLRPEFIQRPSWSKTPLTSGTNRRRMTRVRRRLAAGVV